MNILIDENKIKNNEFERKNAMFRWVQIESKEFFNFN